MKKFVLVALVVLVIGLIGFIYYKSTCNSVDT